MPREKMRPAIHLAPFRLAVLALCLLFANIAAAENTMPSLVVDMESGRVLHAQREFERWRPASITKLMTAYVAFREIESGTLTLKSPVRVSLNAARKPPSHMAYPIGTIVTLDNALKMLLVKSANDIAVAIAESVSGSVEEFAKRMNAEAARLGMMDSHFVNPHGLHDEGQYSSAYDLALLARAIRRDYPQYDHYFSTEALKDGETVYDSYNILLGRFAGADGMKTGYICESGFNLVASATRNGHTLIAVVLGEMSSKGRAERAADLLELGFARLDRLDSLPLLSALLPPADHTTGCRRSARHCLLAGGQRRALGEPLARQFRHRGTAPADARPGRRAHLQGRRAGHLEIRHPVRRPVFRRVAVTRRPAGPADRRSRRTA
jgi:D-alanyl-D-alanine carboxypeptidase